MQQITQAVRSLRCTNSLGIGLLTCGIATLCAYSGALAKPVERVGDWEIVCAKVEQTQASPSKSACRMIQNHVVRGKDPKLAATVLLVTILPAAHKADEKASRKTRMPVVFPLARVACHPASQPANPKLIASGPIRSQLSAAAPVLTLT